MAATRPPRRPAKPRALVRGEPVVRGVIEATFEELARTGYGALRIEDVAARARVNKTTVYRRWPTKEELVRAALLSVTEGRFIAPDTGSLRTDILELARGTVALLDSCQGQGLFRMLLAEGPESELMAIARSMKKGHDAVPRAVIEAAAARGELAAGADAMLVFRVLMAAVHHRRFMENEALDEAFLVRLVDLLLYGAMPPGQRAAGGAPAASPQAKPKAKGTPQSKGKGKGKAKRASSAKAKGTPQSKAKGKPRSKAKGTPRSKAKARRSPARRA